MEGSSHCPVFQRPVSCITVCHLGSLIFEENEKGRIMYLVPLRPISPILHLASLHVFFWWDHWTISELLLADDGASIAGKFLLRSKGDSNDDFILSVIYKKTATHHAVVRGDEQFTVNKQPTDGATTLEQVRSRVCNGVRTQTTLDPVLRCDCVRAK